MSHQTEIEKRKYRNWVRGGLAYKYLKQGLEGFADDVVKQNHKRILKSINYIPGTICSRCSIGSIRPLHTSRTDSVGKITCRWGQHRCNCLHTKKEKCRLHICDYIMEEILKTHGSTPPTPNWANTDIQKWCTEPWEVAKCFINSPGYSDKTKAADIDISGILHVFINNTNLHSHLACSMTGKNNFIKVRESRNKLFHSATMEMEDGEVAECIDDIIEILDDRKQLKGRLDAQQAVNKLKQLKENKFVITTNNEVDVCKEALMFVSKTSDELKQTIEDGKREVKNVIDKDTTAARESIHEAVKEFDEHRAILYERVKHMETDVPKKVKKIKTDVSERVGKMEKVVNERVRKLEYDVSVLKSDISSMKERQASLENKVKELDSVRQIYRRRLDFVKEKQELQGELVKYYKRYYVKTSISPLKQQQDVINVKDVYVPPEMEIIEENQCADSNNSKQNMSKKKYVKGYHDIFQTHRQQNKKIYIIGEVGTGKSTFCKMMIENWCNAVTGENRKTICEGNITEQTNAIISDMNMANTRTRDDDVNQMEQYEFLFFIPLQYMPSLKSDVTVDMIKELTRDFTSDTDLIERIFQEDSRRCIIIADSLDEWTPPREIVRKPHISYGIPNGDRAKDATIITLSGPSAKGILNLKKSEVDIKIILTGISYKSLNLFIMQYFSLAKSTRKSYKDFMAILKSKQIKHVEKTPLLLQQLLWLYCNGKEIGKSVSETFCLILNAIFCWSDHKKEGHDSHASETGYDHKADSLPEVLQRFPRLGTNKRVLFRLGRIAYETYLSEKIKTTFGISYLIRKGLSKGDIKELTQFGLLNESNCYDPTLKDTRFAFTHFSYLEFFVALYFTLSYSTEQSASIPGKVNDRKRMVLKEFFGTCTSASDALQLSNVIKMVCGLSPILISDLSARITCIANQDEHILHLRKNMYQEIGWNDEIVLIQRLMVKCLKECGTDDKTIISLSDLYVDEFEPMPPLHRIKPEDVISLTINSKSVVDYLGFTTQCSELQYMHISHISFTEMPELTSLLQQVFVKQLTLNNVPSSLPNSGFLPVFISDLSKQNKLQILKMAYCKNLKISNLNTEQLEQVHIKCCTEILDFDISSKASRLTELHVESYTGDLVSLPSVLQQAPLRQLTLYDVKCSQRHKPDTPSIHNKLHYIDLSRQNNLQNLKFERCYDIVITALNTEKLEYVVVDNYNISDLQLLSKASKLIELHLETVNINIESLTRLLQQTSLRQLTLIQVSDVKCDMPVIDLSNQSHLQKLVLMECENITIAKLNTERLELLHFSPDVLDYSLVLDASRLSELFINSENFKINPFQYTKEVSKVVHSLHQLRKLKFWCINVDDNALTVIPEMKSLTDIELCTYNCITLETWGTFLDSLLTLEQSVMVNLHAENTYLYTLQVAKHPLFEVIIDRKRSLHFKRIDLYI
ncbi:uncharacterized protein LOC132757075 [Ruditapes philippinarum]|uniref:uncharacterized protein LOC132757075 n=1 Tax=Ruditapes philippinarum TaxID=129788 RepID=UPI00295B2834|nr:uncharacterized protein LOC132757075 [Ruditapes philippinarum]